MKVWGRVRKDNKTIAESVVEIEAKTVEQVEDWSEPIGEICHELDLGRPIILQKHINDFNRFSHTFFKPRDFLETVNLDRLEIELF